MTLKTLKVKRYNEMNDIISCNQQLEEMMDECSEIIRIENPTAEQIANCAREWWVGIR